MNSELNREEESYKMHNSYTKAKIVPLDKKEVTFIKPTDQITIMNKDSQTLEEKISVLVNTIWDDGFYRDDSKEKRKQELTTLLNTEIEKAVDEYKSFLSRELQRLGDELAHHGAPKSLLDKDSSYSPKAAYGYNVCRGDIINLIQISPKKQDLDKKETE
jgi:hypothetical protein